MKAHQKKQRDSLSVICLVLFACTTVNISSCKKNDVEQKIPNQHLESGSVATQWADMTLYVLRHAKYNSPTYSSRSLGYLGLTMYETVVYADSSMRSMKGQLNGLTTLPVPENDDAYYWPLVLNAGQQSMLKYLYPLNSNSTADLFASIDSLYTVILKQKSAGIAKPTVDRSVLFGKSIAAAIYEWSKNDGGDNGFLRHFDPSFSFPSGPSYWVPPARGQTITNYPLHPYWGKNRTFVTTNSQMPIPSITAYSKDPATEYYKMYKAVYEKNKILTTTEKEIAAWWADDPTETYSPPGHSYNLATLVVKKSNAPLVKAAETYARVGMAVADAFINCWKAKFNYFNERPSTYVRATIDPNWMPFWPEPPFPAFPSGHSTQSAGTATVLAGLYGEQFSFSDNTHEGAIRFPFSTPMKPRSFTSFWETAEESGYSRLLGGIHTQQDNTVGLAEGKKIGQNVNALSWKK
jgi:hypothetical protein